MNSNNIHDYTNNLQLATGPRQYAELKLASTRPGPTRRRPDMEVRRRRWKEWRGMNTNNIHNYTNNLQLATGTRQKADKGRAICQVA